MECPVCGNEVDFDEITTQKWIVDGEGNRETKISEETKFFCRKCSKEIA